MSGGGSYVKTKNLHSSELDSFSVNKTMKHLPRVFEVCKR